MKRGQNRSFSSCNFFSKNRRGKNSEFLQYNFFIKKGRRENNRGLSTIVITLIITLLALVAIGIVWVVIKNLLTKGSNEVGFEQFTTKLDITNAYEQSGDINVVVKRNVGKGNLIKIKFVLTGGENSEVITEDTNLQELESGNFVMSPSDFSATTVSEVSIAPVIQLSDGTERLLDITDTYNLIHLEADETIPQNEPEEESGGGGTGGDSGEQPPEGECTPACSGSTPYCVTGDCAECRDTLDCTGTDTCINGVCVSLDCVPETSEQTCGTWECGTRVNNCGALLGCGTCDDGMFCHGGICEEAILINEGTVEEIWPGESGMYFGSSDLPIENADYTGYYLSYLDGTECLLIALFRTPGIKYTNSHIGFNFETSISVNDHYQIWQTQEECLAVLSV